jgi:serine/threonine protein kinase
MVACPDEEVMLEFIEGRLSGRELDGVDLHVDACSGCRQVAFGELPNDGGGTREPGPMWGAHKLVAGRYEIIRFIDRGGMGEVYEARDLTLGTLIAIKALEVVPGGGPPALARLKREVLLARRVTHPGVCRIFDMGREGDVCFLTMELLNGKTLRARLRDRGALSAREARIVAVQLAGALAAAHAVGVVHGDLKPENVMLLADDGSGDPRTVITDFGLARSVPRSAHHLELTDSFSGRVIGTPAYMAPEQIDGTGATPRSDLYALGVVLCEILTGRRWAFDRRWIDGPLDPMRSRGVTACFAEGIGLPRAWEVVIRRCLEPDASRRCASGLEIVQTLNQVAWLRPQAALTLVPVLGLLGVLALPSSSVLPRSASERSLAAADTLIASPPAASRSAGSPPVGEVAVARRRLVAPLTESFGAARAGVRARTATARAKPNPASKVFAQSARVTEPPNLDVVPAGPPMIGASGIAATGELLDPSADDQLIDAYGSR